MKFNKLFLVFLILLMPMALALDFEVTCPQQVAEGISYHCDVILPTAPNTGLLGLTFTITTTGNVNVDSVAFPQGTPISEGSTYGFFSMSPILTPSTTVAKLSVSGDGSIHLIGVSASLGDYSKLTPNELNFPFSIVALTAQSNACTAGNWAHQETACSAECGPGTKTVYYTQIGDCEGGVTNPGTSVVNCNLGACADTSSSSSGTGGGGSGGSSGSTPTVVDCPAGKGLVNGECKDVVVVDSPADKTTLQSIYDTLKNTSHTTLQKITGIANILKSIFS